MKSRRCHEACFWLPLTVCVDADNTMQYLLQVWKVIVFKIQFWQLGHINQNVDSDIEFVLNAQIWVNSGILCPDGKDQSRLRILRDKPKENFDASSTWGLQCHRHLPAFFKGRFSRLFKSCVPLPKILAFWSHQWINPVNPHGQRKSLSINVDHTSAIQCHEASSSKWRSNLGNSAAPFTVGFDRTYSAYSIIVLIYIYHI